MSGWCGFGWFCFDGEFCCAIIGGVNDYEKKSEGSVDGNGYMNSRVGEVSLLKRIDQYVEILLEYNKKTNLISRKITTEGLNQLLDETLLLESYLQ